MTKRKRYQQAKERVPFKRHPPMTLEDRKTKVGPRPIEMKANKMANKVMRILPHPHAQMRCIGTLKTCSKNVWINARGRRPTSKTT